MIKSKITASVMALSMAIPAVSWSSNLLDEDRLKSQSKKGITTPIKEEPSTLESAAVCTGTFLIAGGISLIFPFFVPALMATGGIIGLYKENIAKPQAQLKEEIKDIKSENILLKNQLYFTQTDVKTLKSDNNILKPQMHSTIEDLSNLKTNTYLLFDQQNKTIETLIDSTEKSFHDLESKL